MTATLKPTLSRIACAYTVMDAGQMGPYHGELLEHVSRLAGYHGFEVAVYRLTEYASPDKFIRDILSTNVIAFLLVGPANQEPGLTLLKRDIPSVVLGDLPLEQSADAVLFDDAAGGHMACAHLVALGHRSVALVTGPLAWRVTQERLKGAISALSGAGIPQRDILILEGDFTYESGFNRGCEIAKNRGPPTAVFCFNDEMAVGVIDALRAGGWKVPEDVSVMGFDDVNWAHELRHALTTVRLDRASMATHALLQIQRRLSAPASPITTILPPELVIRRTTAFPRAG